MKTASIAATATYFTAAPARPSNTAGDEDEKFVDNPHFTINRKGKRKKKKVAEEPEQLLSSSTRSHSYLTGRVFTAKAWGNNCCMRSQLEAAQQNQSLILVAEGLLQIYQFPQ